MTAPRVSSPDDELDARIDAALDRVSRFVAFWLRLGLISGAIVWVLFLAPFSASIRPPLAAGFAYAGQNWFLLLFQALFALVFVIAFIAVEFAAVLWIVGRGHTRWLMPGEIAGEFKDFHGHPGVLEVATHVVQYLKGARAVQAAGGHAQRGLLIAGPPGAGKTFLASCIAREAGVPLALASAPRLESMLPGVSGLRIAALYRQARRLARQWGSCVILVREIDTMRPAPGGAGIGRALDLLTELAHQMDQPATERSAWDRLRGAMGLGSAPTASPAILTIGTACDVRAHQPALLGPARFDWAITIDCPDFAGRQDIIEHHLGRIKCDPTLPFDQLALDTAGYTAGAIRRLIDAAVALANGAGRDRVEYRDFACAMEMSAPGRRARATSRPAEAHARVTAAYEGAGAPPADGS